MHLERCGIMTLTGFYINQWVVATINSKYNKFACEPCITCHYNILDDSYGSHANKVSIKWKKNRKSIFWKYSFQRR